MKAFQIRTVAKGFLSLVKSLRPPNFPEFRWLWSLGAAIVAIVFMQSSSSVAQTTERITSANSPNDKIDSFIESHCLDCHDDLTAKGGLKLQRVPFDLADSEWRDLWVRIFDRIEKQEMPPDREDLPDEQRRALLTVLDKALYEADKAEVVAKGRGPLRRLTREEYENNLRDLLKLPHLDIRDRLTEDRTSEGFTKVASTLDMSRVQLEAYLGAAEVALHKAVASAVKPEEPMHYRALGTDLFPLLSTHGGPETMFFAKNGKMVPISNGDLKEIQKSGKRDPALEMALFRSAAWPYYAYPRGFLAKREGAYRVRFSARAVRQVRDFRLNPASMPAPMTFRARQPSKADVSGDVRATGGLIDVLPEPSVFETIIHLKAGETFEYSLLGLPVPHPITSHGGPLYYDFPPMPAEGHPGVAFQWLEVEGPIVSKTWPPTSHRVLFDDLPIRNSKPGGRMSVEVVSKKPNSDAKRLFKRFAAKAARRPVPESAQETFLKLIKEKLQAGAPFAEAMLTGYKAFLCSGHFLYLPEPHAAEDHAHFAIASRLSHFFWNSRPDAKLERTAAEGFVNDLDTLRAEVDRLIDDARFERFVTQFTDEWLDLNELRRDIADIRLYPEYRKDDYLVESMERETRAFFKAMIRDNLPAAVLVDSDFTFVNDRLARHYGLHPVSGSAMRRVTLPQSSPYGGFLTQASIMKITANGTMTSPVLRGAWIMEKLLGDPPPKPPTAVPAVEPDIRGTSTMREILARHTDSKACSACHARFDPVGFALENFDVMGAWRDRYRGMEKGHKITGIDRAGHQFEYRVAQPVDAFGQLRTGETFEDIRDLKKIFAARPRQLARNLLYQFTLYATGTSVRFSDRRDIVGILDQCQPDGYRVRDLLHGLIQSRIFLGFPSDTQFASKKK